MRGHDLTVMIAGVALCLGLTACKSGDTPPSDPPPDDKAGDGDVADPDEGPGDGEPADEEPAADEPVISAEGIAADDECRASCDDDKKSDTDVATCRLNCLTEKGHSGESPGQHASRLYLACADSCVHGEKIEMEDPCRTSCRDGALEDVFPEADDVAKRECAAVCFDTGFICGAKCIEAGSTTDELDPCGKVCLGDAKTCLDAC